MVFLTRDYVPSRNCRRELSHAHGREKRLLVVREMDANHGTPKPSQPPTLTAPPLHERTLMRLITPLVRAPR